MIRPNETVMSFKSEMEAELARSKLASAGIVSDVHRFSRYRALASGGYLLKVAPNDAGRARMILGMASVNVEAAPLSTPVFLLSVVMLGLPFLFIPRNWSCRKCEHRWRK